MEIVSCDVASIEKIVTIYENGGIIAFPTDTVYGLGCDPFNRNSTSKIFELKNRDGEKKFPILGMSKNELEKIVEFNSDADKIAGRFWPGQVTLLLPIREEVKDKIENNGKLAVRVPENDCILSILKQCKLIIGTSANISGEKSILDSDELKIKLPDVDVLVDGGKIVSSGESTIIDFIDGKLKMIREGSVTKESIEKIL
tara:strand:- start:219 stop:818 length:600 start_codon:yes stop_codon:yes gene_type:complete